MSSKTRILTSQHFKSNTIFFKFTTRELLSFIYDWFEELMCSFGFNQCNNVICINDCFFYCGILFFKHIAYWCFRKNVLWHPFNDSNTDLKRVKIFIGDIIYSFILSESDVMLKNGFRTLLESLWSKIRCPVEVNPAWRW